MIFIVVIDPDAPASVSVNGTLEMIAVENFTAKLVLVKPVIQKGIIRKYVLSRSCVDPHSEANAIELPVIEYIVTDENRNSYQLDVPSLPSSSICNISIAAGTSVGIGEKAHCVVETPFTSIFYIYLALNLSQCSVI